MINRGRLSALSASDRSAQQRRQHKPCLRRLAPPFAKSLLHTFDQLGFRFPPFPLPRLLTLASSLRRTAYIYTHLASLPGQSVV